MQNVAVVNERDSGDRERSMRISTVANELFNIYVVVCYIVVPVVINEVSLFHKK